MGKVHGSLARAGKVRGQTPKVAKATDKPKKKAGRAKKRIIYNRRFVNVVVGLGKKKGPNSSASPPRARSPSPERRAGRRAPDARGCSHASPHASLPARRADMK